MTSGIRLDVGSEALGRGTLLEQVFGGLFVGDQHVDPPTAHGREGGIAFGHSEEVRVLKSSMAGEAHSKEHARGRNSLLED